MSRMPGVGQSFGSVGPGGALGRPSRSDSRFDTSVGRRDRLSPVRISVPEADQTGVATAAALEAVAGTTRQITEDIGAGLERREERRLALIRQTRLNQAESREADAAFANQRSIAAVGRVMPALREGFANIEAEIRRGAIVPEEGQTDAELAQSLMDEQLAGIDEGAAAIIRDKVQPKLQDVITDARLRFEEAERQGAVDLLAAGAVDGDVGQALAAAREVDPTLVPNDFLVRAANAALAAEDTAAYERVIGRFDPSASPEDAIRLEILNAKRDALEAEQFSQTLQQASEYIDKAVYDIGGGRYEGRVGNVLEDIDTFVDTGVISADEGRIARDRIQSALQEQVVEQERQAFASTLTGLSMNLANTGQRVPDGLTISGQQVDEKDVFSVVDGHVMAVLGQRLAAGDASVLPETWQSLDGMARSNFGMVESETAKFLMSANPSQIDTENGTVSDRAMFGFANYNGLMDVNATLAAKNAPSDMKPIYALARAGVQIGQDERFSLVQAAATVKAETQHGLSSNRITLDAAFEHSPESYKLARRSGSADPMLHLVSSRARVLYAQGNVSDEQAVKAAWNELEGQIGMLDNQAILLGDMTQQELDAIDEYGIDGLWQFDNSPLPPGFGDRSAVTIGRQPWRGGMFVVNHEDGRQALFTEGQMKEAAAFARSAIAQRPNVRSRLRRDLVAPVEPYLPSQGQVADFYLGAARQASSIADRLQSLPRRIYESNTGVGQLLRGEQNEFGLR